MQAITTKYLGPTDTKGSRIKVSSYCGSKTYSYDHSENCPHDAAFESFMKEVINELSTKSGVTFKLAAKGGLPDGKGVAYIVK